jgi:D-alanyl-D-alanine carboxypeptidase
MTTIVALRLVDRKIITLDKPMGYWLPDLPSATKNRVTLRHLLSNTSGIPNGVMDSYRKDPVKTSMDMPADEAAYIYGSGALNAEPGKVWDYSLTNWVLVRAILEKASGKSFSSLISDELVRPLKLEGTGISSADFEDTPLAAVGYTSLSPLPQRKANPIPSYAAASGTFYSTVDDLRHVANEISQGSFLSASSRRELTTVHVPNQGYALGGRVVSLSEASNRKIYWEPGETGMFRAVLGYDPANGACVVILNNTGMSPDDLGGAAKQTLQNISSRR